MKTTAALIILITLLTLITSDNIILIDALTTSSSDIRGDITIREGGLVKITSDENIVFSSPLNSSGMCVKAPLRPPAGPWIRGNASPRPHRYPCPRRAGAKTSELAVVVLPLAAGRDGFDRVPMLHELAPIDAEEIIERGMNPILESFAHGKDEVALRKHAMDAGIRDCETRP